MNYVVYIGPEHKNHRGGIGAVLDVYSKHIHPFKFIRTYVRKSFVQQALVYVASIFRLIYVLATDRTVKILHIHHASKGSFMRKSVLFFIGKMFGKKIILHIHGGGFHNFYKRSRLLKPVIKYVLEHADAIICLSENWKKYYSETFKLKRLEIVNNVIEDPSVQSFARNGSVNLLFLGHITERKGLFDLLKVLGTNKSAFDKKITFTIAGVGDEQKLNKAIESYQFNGEVKFAGWVNGAKKSELLNKCDVYVLPSYNEGLPVSILEAMSYGKPVIATAVGGVPEIVKPGYNGWLFKPGDHEALRNIIGEVLEDRERLKQFGENSLKISRDYTPEAIVQSLDKLYEQIIKG